MSTRAIAGIVTDASLTVVNDIWNHAFGWGPGNFSVALSEDGQAPASHYGMYAASVAEADAITWQQLCDGILPPADWGGDFLPSEQDAIDACGDDNLILNSQAGGGSSVEHFNGILSGLGLQRIE